jgi:hypothetical protein
MIKRSSQLALLVMLVACATTSTPPREPALPLLFASNGKLGWGGLTLGMSRASAERVLGHSIRVRRDPYADACGEYYSMVAMHGQSVLIEWSGATPAAVIDVIGLSYGADERSASDEERSRSALAAVPELVAEFPSYLVLKTDSAQAVNLKSSTEGTFYVTAEGCVD